MNASKATKQGKLKTTVAGVRFESGIPALSVNDAAELLGCSRDSIKRAIARGDLRMARFGRRILVLRESIVDLLGRGEAA